MRTLPKYRRISYLIQGLAPAGGGAFELNAEAGSYAVTGIAATLAAGRLFNAETGAYSLTGLAAELAKGFAMNAEPGAYAVNGVAASVLRDALLVADVGAYVLSGVSASTLRGAILSGDPGSYLFSGVDAELVFTPATGAFEMSADPGIFDLSGLESALEFVSVQVQPDRRPMGFVGISFRRRKRDVVIETTESANPAEVAVYVEERLEQAGIPGKDITGLILRGELSSKARRELEALLAFRETEDLPGVELEQFLAAQQAEAKAAAAARAEALRVKRNTDAILAIIIASEL